jgi:hypothetical protein
MTASDEFALPRIGVIDGMRQEGLFTAHAVGGATGVLFYAEPTRTYDVNVFIILPPDDAATLSPLDRLYRWADAENFEIAAEHVMIHGVPVQFLPAYNQLVEDAVRLARTHAYEGTTVNVVDPEHLVALALQAGGARRRERAWQLLQSGAVDVPRLRAILAAHRIAADIPDDV